MYSEEIEHLSYYSDENTNANKIRNAYFENRSCLANVLEFLDQEVVIVPSKYFSYPLGLRHIIEDNYIYADTSENSYTWDFINGTLMKIVSMKRYHLCVLDNYITIISDDRKCIFTNRDMRKNIRKDKENNAIIIGTIFWVKNFNELLKNFSDRNLKRISKAIVCPNITKINSLGKEFECLDKDLFLSMDIYKPEVIFNYSIDTYMSNVCIDVYNKLVKIGLNGLVDRYIPTYKQCDGYGEKGKENDYNTKLCKCGGLRAFCYLNF
jgi:hypothetical protein